MTDSRPGQVQAPDGRLLDLASAEEDRAAYPDAADRDALRTFFQEQGYVVAHGLVPSALCAEARAAFHAEIEPHDGPLWRVETMRPERHNVSAHGHMTNALLNVHQLPPDRFPRFSAAVLRVVTHPALVDAVAGLLGEPPKLVQSMYFEGGRGTPLHMDTHLFDSHRLGTMIGSWVALEEIASGAGRFCVYPRSHRLGASDEPPFASAASRFREYEELVLLTIRQYQEGKGGLSPGKVTRAMDLLHELIRSCGLRCVAPALGPGDVVFWTSRTVHGSLRPTQPERTRNSINAHFIAESDDYVIYHERPVPLRLTRVNGIGVNVSERSLGPGD